MLTRGERRTYSVTTYDDHDREYLDIPEEVISLNNYRASLGHKINHSFQPNCKWDQTMHPTFGRIPSVITLLDLKAGTELTCHYMIDMQEAAGIDHLQWYLDLWDEESNDKKDCKENLSYDNQQRISSNNG